MKKLIAGIFATLIATSSYAALGFLKYDYESGSNRICVYDVLGSDVAITIKSYQTCKYSMNF